METSEAGHGAFYGKLNGLFNAACFCIFLIKVKKCLSCSTCHTAAILRLLLLSLLVEDSNTWCSCLGNKMESRKEDGSHAYIRVYSRQ